MSKNIVLKKATFEDIQILWEIRNNPKVKENFFDTSSVSFEEHKRWFIDKMGEENTEIYIAEDNGVKIGSVRFEDSEGVTSGVSSVSISIDSNFFGKGYGSEMIKLGTKIFLKVHKKNKIVARIKKDNIASQKVFEKAGYTRVSKKENEIIYEKQRNNHS